MIREPVERIASSFYYSRAVAARRRNATRCKALGVLQESCCDIPIFVYIPSTKRPRERKVVDGYTDR
ncbi:hypothetical protein HPB50_020766 [Hyalomma asiaticum]|uniref:Uncharacterized protein n=1 Tax=Hyalomma asiaticum TaxID=266040 RepID=A0ACB7RJG1_HYAAI|nr:hypothetical protein HPB50_020766 [Hyalomma asiaticum]